ncbi:hypothetical protein Godav_026878 [Gossypium davidsonii]|uniref:MalT-like TPR region domain-containing protein n=1 Tax=Gossypium davidsonii TaxID=34287 RepID=A0A7J8RV38_GOSDV|nr:hypothetical protein [Gossypium davidsonii]
MRVHVAGTEMEAAPSDPHLHHLRFHDQSQRKGPRIKPTLMNLPSTIRIWSVSPQARRDSIASADNPNKALITPSEPRNCSRAVHRGAASRKWVGSCSGEVFWLYAVRGYVFHDGSIGRSINSYESGLRIQIEALGDSDPRTCSAPGPLEEAADHLLMALVCEAKGDYESALEHLVRASMSMIANGQENEVANIDVSIGNIYLSLCRFDEAIFAYQKALNSTGKLRESKFYSENAFRIYSKQVPGTTPEEIAGGLTEVSAIYEALN